MLTLPDNLLVAQLTAVDGLKILCGIGAITLLFFAARAIAYRRLRDYAAGRGWRVLDLSLEKMGRRRSGPEGASTYLMRYQTAKGAVCAAWIKSSGADDIRVAITALIEPGSDENLKKLSARAASCLHCGTTTPQHVPYCPYCKSLARRIP